MARPPRPPRPPERLPAVLTDPERHPNASGPSGWVAPCGHIAMDGFSSTVTYTWDGVYHPEKTLAITAGVRLAGWTDDFNLGRVERGRLVWFGWGDEQHPVEGYPAVAAQFGWEVD